MLLHFYVLLDFHTIFNISLLAESDFLVNFVEYNCFAGQFSFVAAAE